MATRGSRRINVNVTRYWQAVAVSAIPLLVALILWMVSLLFPAFGIHIGDFTIPYWLLFLLAPIPYYIAGINFVETDEFYGVTVLEIPTIEGESGFVYVPPLLAELHRFPRSEQQDEFPGEPERVSSMPDEDADRMESTLLKPIRITTGGPETGPYADELKDEITNTQMTFEPRITVAWQVELDEDSSDHDQGFWEFYVNLPGGGSWQQKYRSVLKRMRDTAQKELANIMAKHSGAWSIKYIDVLNDAVKAKIAEAVDKWGITICEVNVLNITPSHAVNIALNKIPEASASGKAAIITATTGAEATKITAEAQKQKLILEGQGVAEARKALLASEGEGEHMAAEALGMEGVDYRTSKVAETLGDKTVVVGAAGFLELLNLGKGGSRK